MCIKPISMLIINIYLFVYIIRHLLFSSLGGGPEDVKEIKIHPFFTSINWKDLVEKKVCAVVAGSGLAFLFRTTNLAWTTWMAPSPQCTWMGFRAPLIVITAITWNHSVCGKPRREWLGFSVNVTRLLRCGSLLVLFWYQDMASGRCIKTLLFSPSLTKWFSYELSSLLMLSAQVLYSASPPHPPPPPHCSGVSFGVQGPATPLCLSIINN